MKRNETILVICGLLLLADYLCFMQTVQFRENLDAAVLASLITAEAIAAAMLASVGLLVLRKTYARQKKPANRRTGFAIVQPLRRLFVSVWS